LGAAAASLVPLASCVAASSGKESPYRAHGKHIRHSVVQWCYGTDPNPMTSRELAMHAKTLGIESVEVVPPEDYKMLDELGLKCALATIDMSPDPPFVKGFNNPRFHDRVIKATRDSIDAAAAHGVPQVISFSGYSAVDPDDPKSPHISRDDGIKNCIAGYKKVIGHAEKKGVVVSFEMLNTRDDTHPMKGHPGYQANDLEYVVEVIDAVGSPNLKLLFDVYHVQVMQGDVIRRLRELKEYTSHYHVAGNPGRGEIDDSQEISYPAVMKAIAETGYKGFVAQEFIPTLEDKIGALRSAIQICDV
jgi:hydroxypyruvate isomerase